jgi:hypothetical protein
MRVRLRGFQGDQFRGELSGTRMCRDYETEEDGDDDDRVEAYVEAVQNDVNEMVERSRMNCGPREGIELARVL